MTDLSVYIESDSFHKLPSSASILKERVISAPLKKLIIDRIVGMDKNECYITPARVLYIKSRWHDAYWRIKVKTP